MAARCLQTCRAALEDDVFIEARAAIPWLGNRIFLS
jgi:hypothetical protein